MSYSLPPLVDQSLLTLLFVQHDPALVALSVLVAIFGATMALQLAHQARMAHEAAPRRVALTAGALSLSAAIWAMHFIGVLALEQCVDTRYTPGLTLLTVIPGQICALLALGLLITKTPGLLRCSLSGLLIVAGIEAMHYIGMLTLALNNTLDYQAPGFLGQQLAFLSLVILALWLRFRLACPHDLQDKSGILAGGLILGLAFSGLHYDAISATYFSDPGAGCTSQDSNAELAFVVAGATMLISFFVAGANGYLHYRFLYNRLQRSESRLRTMVDTAVDGIISIDGGGSIRSFNRAAEHIFGWRADEVIGRNVNILMPEPYHSAHDGYLARHLSTGHARIIGTGRETLALRKDGSLLPIRLAIGRVPLADEEIFVGFVSDISERQRIEHALSESERQFRSLISNIPGVAFRCHLDSDWSMIYISDAVEAITGWPARDFVAKRIHFGQLIHPHDQAAVFTAVTDALKRHQPYSIEYRLITRNMQEI